MSLEQDTPVDVTDGSTRQYPSFTGHHPTEGDGILDIPDGTNLAEIKVWHDSLYNYFERPKQVTRCKHDLFAWPRDWGKPKGFARPEGWTSWKDYYTGKGLLGHRGWPRRQGIAAVELAKKLSPGVKDTGSRSLANRVLETPQSQIQGKDAAFRRLFELRFPIGYTTIPNTSKSLLCGIHALTDSLRAQLPDEHITLKDKWKNPTRSGTILELPREDLFDDINRAFLPESSFTPNEPFGGFVWKSKETIGVVDANLEDERSFYHLALLTSGLKRWGRNRGLNLALGCVYANGSCRVETGEDRVEDDDAQQDAPDDAEARRAKTLPETTIWIRSNCDIQTGLPQEKRAAHYEGIRANEPGDAVGQRIGGSRSPAGRKRLSEQPGDVGGDDDCRPLKRHKPTSLDLGGSNSKSPAVLLPPNDDDSIGLPAGQKRKHGGDLGDEDHGSESLSNKKPKTISDTDINPAVAKAMFDSQFVNGYSTIPNHSTGLKCGIEALTDSLRAQLPTEAVSFTSRRGTGDLHLGYIEELDRAMLFHDLEWAMDPEETEEFEWTETEREELRIHGLENDKGDYNVSTLSACLRRWGRKRAERDLCLGCRLANGTCVPVHYHGSNDTIIWISSTSKTGRSASDNSRFSTQTGGKKRKRPVVYDHYEGIQPNKPKEDEEAQDKDVSSDDSLFNGSSLASSQGSGSTGGKNQENDDGTHDGPNKDTQMDDLPSELAQKPFPTNIDTGPTPTAPMIPGLFLLHQASSQGASPSQTPIINITTQNQEGDTRVNHTATSFVAEIAADMNAEAGSPNLNRDASIQGATTPGSDPDANRPKQATSPHPDSAPSWDLIDLKVPSAFKKHYTHLLHRISNRLNLLYPPPSVPLREEAAVLLPRARALKSIADAWLKLPYILFRHTQLTSISDKALDAIRTDINNNSERVHKIAEELATRLALPPPSTPPTPTVAAPPESETHREWLMKVDRLTLAKIHHELIKIVKHKTEVLGLKQKMKSQAMAKATDGPGTCLGFDTFREAREAVMAMNGIVDRLDELQFAAVECETFDNAETGAQLEGSDKVADQMDSVEEENSPVQSHVEVGDGKEGIEEHGTDEVEDSPEGTHQEAEDDREQDDQEGDVEDGNGEEDDGMDDTYIEDKSDREQEEQIDEPHDEPDESEEDEQDRKATEEAQRTEQAEKAEKRKQELRKVSLNELEREVAREEGLPDELGEWS